MTVETQRKFQSDACIFRDAAIADGWAHKPTYNMEPESQACTLNRDGWHMSVYTREKNGRYDTSITIWAPDGLVVNVPAAYDFDKIKAGIEYCGTCKTHGVKTTRVGFAGRVCFNCLPEQRAKIEVNGWCD